MQKKQRTAGRGGEGAGSWHGVSHGRGRRVRQRLQQRCRRWCAPARPPARMPAPTHQHLALLVPPRPPARPVPLPVVCAACVPTCTACGSSPSFPSAIWMRNPLLTRRPQVWVVWLSTHTCPDPRAKDASLCCLHSSPQISLVRQRAPSAAAVGPPAWESRSKVGPPEVGGSSPFGWRINCRWQWRNGVQMCQCGAQGARPAAPQSKAASHAGLTVLGRLAVSVYVARAQACHAAIVTHCSSPLA